jgi:hypothetical protein
MNVSLKRSIATCIIFGILFLYLILFFSIIGPEKFLVKKIYTVISAVVIMLSMLSFALMLLFTNKKENVVDERDYVIQRKASSTGLLVSLIYVFILSITLFVVYRDNGTINVSWMWFIAYSTFAFGYFFTSLFHIYLYNYEN